MAIIIFVCSSVAITIGVKKLCRNLFYYTTCHCLLKQIIKIRNGVRWEEQIAKPINKVLENDEDMAEILANESDDHKPNDAS